MRPQPSPPLTAATGRPAMTASDRVAMLLAFFAAQLAVQAAVDIAHRLFRTPAGSLPIWVAVLAPTVLFSSTALAVGAAVRLARVTRTGAVVIVVGGIGSGLGIVALRWLGGLPV